MVSILGLEVPKEEVNICVSRGTIKGGLSVIIISISGVSAGGVVLDSILFYFFNN
jgi:hypothetical protein